MKMRLIVIRRILEQVRQDKDYQFGISWQAIDKLMDYSYPYNICTYTLSKKIEDINLKEVNLRELAIKLNNEV